MATRFCTCTWAMSRLVPMSNVTAMREAAVGGRVRRHVEHVLDAVDLLLDRSDHGGGDDLGAGAGILALHVDDRRRDLGILRDRQAEERHAAENDEHDRDDRGEDRPVDEEVRDPHRPPQLLLACGPAPAPAPCSCGVTLAPGRARTMPLTMTRSFGREARLDHPQVVENVAERDVLLRHGVVVARPSARTCAPARCRSRHPAPAAPRRAASPEPARGANMPGVNRPSALANTARARIVPERAVDHVVDEIHPAAMGEILLVDQLEHDRGGGAPGFAVLALLGQPLVAQQRGLIEGELEPDRIGRHDRGEQRGGSGSRRSPGCPATPGGRRSGRSPARATR